jgi:formate hydrogenlyase transcriptional activator
MRRPLSRQRKIAWSCSKSRAITTDVRVIAATNRDLTSAIAAGTFRTDLFYRLNVFPIEVPSLAEQGRTVP